MPETLVNDAPLLNADGSVPNWNPQNSDGKFDGEITVREGLVRSKNLVSVRLLQHIGLTQARQWIGRFGLTMDKQPTGPDLGAGHRQRHAAAAGQRPTPCSPTAATAWRRC
jgi:penicillin-binding protein 1A